MIDALLNQYRIADQVGVRSGDSWLLIVVGPSGSDVAALDDPWRRMDEGNYNVVSVARFDPNAIWAAGPQGRVTRLLQVPK
jgi:hypothetical protein